MKKNNWIYYTVGVASLPILIIARIYLLLNDKGGYSFYNVVDIIFFSLTLNLSNVYELNTLKTRKSRNKKDIPFDDKNRERFFAWSLFIIIILGVLLGFSYMPPIGTPIFNTLTLLIVTIIIASVSLFLNGYVVNKISKINNI